MIALVLRVYNYDKAFLFAHDQDLYSWIAKDIVINKHLRSVGQITSVDGVFIGPLYYYVMALSYWLSGMNPLSAVVPTTIIGLLTVVSFYFLGKKYFSKQIGLIMAFIYAISFGAAWYDRWSVPTEPAILWTVWFIYVILGIYRKNLKLLPLYGLLAALTYHIHIALVPILPIPIVAYFISGGKFVDNLKKIKIKKVLIALLVFMIVSSPFWVFELRHNFSQVKSVIIASKKDLGNPTGWPKLAKVINASSIEMQQRFFIGQSIKPIWLMWIFWILMIVVVFKFKKIKGKELILLLMWILLIAWAQFTSKRIVSEYYFTNYMAIFILISALFLDIFWKNRYLKLMILGGGFFYLAINLKWMIKITNQINDSYYYRKQLVEYIKADQKNNGYPCIGVNYISAKGDAVGFRYLWWYEGIKAIKPGPNVPTYNIVNPWEISGDEVNEKFGRFGVILPTRKEASTNEWCEMKENQLDQLLGYTE
jgi:4-amino-4-deoxy-L-arabinose transferase-like glycosyltransferase